MRISGYWLACSGYVTLVRNLAGFSVLRNCFVCAIIGLEDDLDSMMEFGGEVFNRSTWLNKGGQPILKGQSEHEI